MPNRFLNRANSLAIGIRGGSIYGGYSDAKGYADPGIGANIRYRPVESVGLEVGIDYYNQTFSRSSERIHVVGQASVQFFAWSWTRFSPYAIAGFTVEHRSFFDDRNSRASDSVETFQETGVEFGPHLGLGMEFALGKTVALDLEARYIAMLTQNAADPTVPGNLQTSVGVMFHF